MECRCNSIIFRGIYYELCNTAALVFVCNDEINLAFNSQNCENVIRSCEML